MLFLFIFYFVMSFTLFTIYTFDLLWYFGILNLPLLKGIPVILNIMVNVMVF